MSRGSDTSSADYVSDIYEVFGHAGVSLLVCTLSDNKNRAVATIKDVAKKSEAKMASSGSVLFQFDHKVRGAPNV